MQAYNLCKATTADVCVNRLGAVGAAWIGQGDETDCDERRRCV